MKQNMKIVCGFPGIGKSYIFDHSEELGIKCLDSDSSIYSWSKIKVVDDNIIKVRNLDFPHNYIVHIQHVIQGEPPMANYIFISTHSEVLQKLSETNLDYKIVIPHINDKETYIDRYRYRGSSKEFINNISSHWEEWLTDIHDKYEDKVIVLDHNQFLFDIIDKL